VAPHFVAGIDVFKVTSGVLGWTEDEYLNDCAPILKYMKKWSASEIRQYCIKKGWGYYPMKNKGDSV